MTKKNSITMTLLLLFSLSYAPLLATESLMFSKKEYADILSKRTQEHLDTLKNKEDCLECNGIIFQGSRNWNVWINGRKIESTYPPGLLHEIENILKALKGVKIPYKFKEF